MRKFNCLLFICLAFTMSAFAQTSNERNVASMVEIMRKAMVDGDKAKLEYIAAADLSYGHSSGTIQNKAEFVEQIASGKSDFVSIDLKDQTIKVTGTTAIVRHKLVAETNDGGKPGNVSLGILLVWQKQGKAWKLLARQAFKL
jgi:ketosteroid isomerase-like protein